MLKTVVLLNIFVDAYIFHDSWTELMNRKLKKWQLYLKYKYFVTMSVFTVTFDLFNAALWNKK